MSKKILSELRANDEMVKRVARSLTRKMNALQVTRAAITVMREPSDWMLIIGGSVAPDCITIGDIEQIWKAMIDAALGIDVRVNVATGKRGAAA